LSRSRPRSQTVLLEASTSRPADEPLTRLDSQLSSKLEKLGATRLYSCYNCGTCTAICPLSKELVEFPRALIRYALLGAEEKLLSSPALWLCYYCGECSDNCPKDADPASFVMATRRYAIERYSWGRIASIFYMSPRASSLGLIALTFIAILGLLLVKGSPTFSSPNLQTFVSFEVIHDVGLWLGAIVGLSTFANLAIMARFVRVRPSKKATLATRLRTWLSTLIGSVIRQSIVQVDFLKCTNRNRYYAHMALFWGFIGLGIATGIDFIIGLGKIPLYPFPPQRVLGISAGVAFTLAATYYLVKRLRKDERHARSSHLTDWVFVILLFLAGITGLLLTLSLYVDSAPIAYSLYASHLVIVFDLLVLAPFTKFAHAVYRPLAIWMNDAALRFSSLGKLEADG
jgi:heterodisulfide reductase subunit C